MRLFLQVRLPHEVRSPPALLLSSHSLVVHVPQSCLAGDASSCAGSHSMPLGMLVWCVPNSPCHLSTAIARLCIETLVGDAANTRNVCSRLVVWMFVTQGCGQHSQAVLCSELPFELE